MKTNSLKPKQTSENTYMIDDILTFNKQFVAEKEYEKYITTGQPDRKLAVLSCMDTRLTELLPKAMGLKNGDAKFIKVAGGTMLSPYDTVMRSLLVAIYELGCEEVMVIHHTNCGLCNMHASHFIELMRRRGIKEEALAEASKYTDLERYLGGFPDIEEDVRLTVTAIRRHPLIPCNVIVRGFIIDSETGQLTEIEKD